MKENMKRLAALLLCMVQLFACLPPVHVHAEGECAHSWQSWNGVCSICGEACPHVDTYETEYSSHYDAVDNGDGTHTGTVERYNARVCTACNYAQKLDVISLKQETEDHYFSDGTCMMCGATSGCAHEETETSLVYSNLRFLQNDGTGHYEIYKESISTRCLNEACGEELSFEYTGNEVSLQCTHVFTDGVCTECKYEATGCTHASATAIEGNYELSSGEWTDNGDGTHSGMVVRVNTMSCADCGAVYADTLTVPFMRTAVHTPSSDGVCPECGYSETTACTHPNAEMTNTYYSLWEGGEWKDNGDGTHSGYSRLVNWWYCFECGTGTPEYVTEPAMNTEAHSMSNGTCTRCGYANACEHPAESVSSEQVWRWVEDSYIEQRDGDVHVQWMEPAIHYTCSACGEGWYDCVTGTLVEFTMNHEYPDGSNVCTVCGYVDDCAHANTKTVKKTNGPVEYKGFTVTTAGHTCWYQSYDALVCADCGKDMNNRTNWQDEQVTEDHLFTDNYLCFVCGYQGSACSHEDSTQTDSHQENEVFYQINETQHLRTFDVYRDYKCADCGETYSLFIEARSEVDDHAFLEDPSLTACNQCGYAKPCATHSFGENGICLVCGYCPHTQTQNPMEFSSKQYPAQAHDEQFHAVPTENLFKYECNTCDATYAKYNLFNIYHAHKFEANGVCVCGETGEPTTCAHTNTETGTYEGDVVYSEITADGHTKVYDYYFYYWCTDCETATYYEVIEDYTRTEEHTLEDGVCACGYSETTVCTHPAESVTGGKGHIWVEGESELKQHNGQYHVQTMQPVLMYVCGACAERWEDPVAGVLEEVLFAHEFNEQKVCVACGYVDACEHAQTTTVRMYGEPVEHFGFTITEKSHTVTLYNSEYTVCADCGKQMVSYGTVVGTKKVTEDHLFTQDGVCYICGYVGGTCQHTNSSQTGGHQQQLGAVQLNETHHVRMFEVYWEYACADCGETYSTFIEAGSETEEHVFATNESGVTACNLCGFEKPACTDGHTLVDGVCSVCGYCQHTQGGSFLGTVTTQAPAQPYDEQFHKVVSTYNRKYQCNACGETYLNNRDLDLYYAHEFDEDGVCVCGAEGTASACEHLEIEYRLEEKNVRYSNITDDGHQKDYDYYNYSCCTACGSDVYYEMTPYSRTENHTLENGVCACGYPETACTHENESVQGKWDNAVYTYVDEELHHAVYDYVEVHICGDCGEEYDVLIEEGREDDEPHEWFINASATDCRFCGAKKPCETHSWEDGVCTDCGEVCEHEDSTKGEHGTWENAEYTIIDETYHHAVYDYAERYTCNTCGKDYTVIVDEGRADLEEHVYASGDKCVFCEACKTHTYENGVCSVCGVKKPCEVHIFSEGECTLCGRVEMCDHENAEQTGRFKRDDAFTAIDEMTHVHTFGVWEKYTCPDCGDSYGVFLEDGCEVDDHAFIHDENLTACNQCGMNKPCTEHSFDERGVCTVCGYCQHIWTTSGNHIGMEMLDPVSQDDDQFHIQPYLSLNERYCNYCEKTFVRASRMEGEEAHTYDENGLCACGATGEPTTCTHEDVTFGPVDITVYSEETLTTHTVKTDVYWMGWCPDCETYRQRQLDMPGTATVENHSYVGGTCSACERHYLEGIGKVYELPADLTEIEAEAFIGSPVEAVIVPDGCVKIGAVAFADCAQLKVVVLPRGAENISRDAFNGCPDVVLFVAEQSAAQAFCEANGYTYLVVE